MLIRFLISISFFFSCAVNTNNTRSFQFTYEVDIESTNGKKLEVWIPIPKTNEVQTISKLKINANGLKYSMEDEKIHGNKYLYINQPNGTTELKKVSIVFDVVRKEHQNVHYENVNPDQYLNSYNSVPVGGIFSKIIDENKLSKNNVRKIYDHVLNGMHYGKPKSVDNQYYQDPWLNADEKYGLKEVNRDEVVKLYQKAKKEKGNYTFGNGNSIYACDIGVGNCTDYHSYFMSLDRTMGIPARFHMGFSIPDGESGEVGGYHCWADYHVENKGWYPVDISEADKDPERADYFFGTVCNNRVEMMVGRDFKLKGYELDFVNLFIYPIMEINDNESFSFKKNFTYKNL